MHLFISYTLEELNEDEKPDLETKVISVIESYENVHVFEKTYIVKVKNQSEWNSILTRLTGVAEMCGCGFKFILGPAHTGEVNKAMAMECMESVRELMNVMVESELSE